MDRPKIFDTYNQKINISIHEALLNRMEHNDPGFETRFVYFNKAKRELELTEYILFLERELKIEHGVRLSHEGTLLKALYGEAKQGDK